MGILRALVTGQPEPIIEAALTVDQTYDVTTFAVDGEAVPPGFFGLESYASQYAPEPRVSRREAVQVPAVKRSRDLVAGTLGQLPLNVVREDLTVDNGSWLQQPEIDVPRSVTMTRTIEDLFYDKIAWWKITEFSRPGDPTSYPRRVVRLDPMSVDVMRDGRVHVTGAGHRGIADEWPKDFELIRFDSPNDALLVAGARAIRQALRLAQAATNAADGAPPVDYFTPYDGLGDPGDDDEIRQVLDDWREARRTRSTGYVPAALKYNLGGWNPDQLELSEQRQHAVLEIARVAGVDPEELGVSTTSRTYANSFDRRKSFLDFTLGAYRAAVEDRLSMGDVTPRTQLVRYDLDAFLRSDPKARFEALKLGLEIGAVDQAEVRPSEGKPALTTPIPRPAPTPAAPLADTTEDGPA